MILQNIIHAIENEASPTLQENYDNSGLQVGNRLQQISAALICLDVTDEIIDEAIEKKCNLIISHHPLIFKGIKSITGKSYIERCIIKACKNDIAIYSAHTNLDNAWNGVNFKIAEKIGLTKLQILREQEGVLLKLAVFVPVKHVENVRNAIFEAGGGHIGSYDACSFNSAGTGTFRAGKDSNPYCGEIGKLHSEEEMRIELIFPVFLKEKIIEAIMSSHPYEEPAYDFYPLINSWSKAGSGLLGELQEDINEADFLNQLKNIFNIPVIKHSAFTGKKIRKIALCGGSGAFLLPDALKKQADVFITGEAKYHDYFGLDKKILFAEIGHYESEQFTKELIYDIIIKKIPTFALHFSKVITNPINYF